MKYILQAIGYELLGLAGIAMLFSVLFGIDWILTHWFGEYAFAAEFVLVLVVTWGSIIYSEAQRLKRQAGK